MTYKNIDKDNEQMNYIYNCDLWIGDDEQKPSIAITEDNSEAIQLEFDFCKDYNNEKE